MKILLQMQNIYFKSIINYMCVWIDIDLLNALHSPKIAKFKNATGKSFKFRNKKKHRNNGHLNVGQKTLKQWSTQYFVLHVIVIVF